MHNLIPPHFEQTLIQWLNDDLPNFDYGGHVVGNQVTKANLLAKSDGLLAGIPFVDVIFNYLGCKVNWLTEEGVLLTPIQKVAQVEGPVNKILIGERLCLNILSRCSGIAYKAYNLNCLKNKHGFKGCIAGTRKTTPGFKIIEKYGMLIGGADTHRMDLCSMVMLKDNHIWTHKSINQAVIKARKACGFSTKIEVECQSIEEAKEAVLAGADVVMLDNMNGKQIIENAKKLKDDLRDSKFLIEASGGIDEHNIAEYFGECVDIISLGNLCQSVKHVDFSLKIEH